MEEWYQVNIHHEISQLAHDYWCLVQISGVAITAKLLNPRIKVFGAEPKEADDAYR